MVAQGSKPSGHRNYDDDLTPEAIRSLRHRLGIRQVDFADRIGCTVQTVSHWELGKNRPLGTHKRMLRRMIDDANADSKGVDEQ